MKRLVRQTLRWTLVVCLVGILSINPASAGWMLYQIQCGAPPVCPPVPTCCESTYPAPVVHFSAPEVHDSSPVQDCCTVEPVCVPEPQPCCGESAPVVVAPVMNDCCESSSLGVTSEMIVGDDVSAPVYSEPIYGEPMMGESMSVPSMIQGDMTVESWSDTGTIVEEGVVGSSPTVEQPFDDVSSEPMIDSNIAVEKAAPPAVPKADATAESDMPKTDDQLSTKPVKPEPKKPEPKAEKPKQAKTPTPKKETPSTDDIFGTDSPAPAKEPAAPSTDDIFGTDSPAPAKEPAAPSTDDIFGTDSPAPAKEPAAPSTDDIFGSDTPAPADKPVPAEKPAPAADNNLDDLFGTGSETMPADPTKPAEPAKPAADSGLDSLFDSAPAETPAPADKPPATSSAEPSIDSLFDDAPAATPPAATPPAATPPAATPATPPAADTPLDDLFGDPPAGEPSPGAKPESNESLDDLFGESSNEKSAAPASNRLEDLFGMPTDSPESTEESKPSPSIDDLFGQIEMPPQIEAISSDVPASDELESYESELPAPLVVAAVKEESTEANVEVETTSVQVVSAKTNVGVDPLAETRTRVWIDNTGEFKTEGRLIEVRADSVRLLKSNGKTCTVPLERMSEADAAYISGIRASIESTPLAMVSPR